MICDFAETYGIIDIFGLSPSLVMTLFFGLRNDSRAKMKLAGQKITLEQRLLAMIADGINWLVWSKTKDASKGRNKPNSILSVLLESDNEKDIETFNTFEDFEKMRQQIIGEKKWQQN